MVRTRTVLGFQLVGSSSLPYIARWKLRPRPGKGLEHSVFVHEVRGEEVV